MWFLSILKCQRPRIQWCRIRVECRSFLKSSNSEAARQERHAHPQATEAIACDPCHTGLHQNEGAGDVHRKRDADNSRGV